MKLYNLKVSRSLSISTAALIAIIFYLILVVILNLLQSVIDPTGEAYNEIYSIVELVIISIYWIAINFFFFSRPGRTGASSIIFYLLFLMLPIICFTVATVSVVEFYPTTDFIPSWNLMTWLVAPTLFWYLPYSYIYFVLNYSVSISIFLGIILVYNLSIICIGIVLGLARRSYVVDKVISKRKEKERQSQTTPSAQIAFDTASSNNLNINDILPENDYLFSDNQKENHSATEILNNEIDRISKQANTNVFDNLLSGETINEKKIVTDIPSVTEVINQKIDEVIPTEDANPFDTIPIINEEISTEKTIGTEPVYIHDIVETPVDIEEINPFDTIPSIDVEEIETEQFNFTTKTNLFDSDKKQNSDQLDTNVFDTNFTSELNSDTVSNLDFIDTNIDEIKNVSMDTDAFDTIHLENNNGDAFNSYSSNDILRQELDNISNQVDSITINEASSSNNQHDNSNFSDSDFLSRDFEQEDDLEDLVFDEISLFDDEFEDDNY